MNFPYLNARDHCPPALRVTRWWEPMPMRRTLVRDPGETEAAFCARAQQLAHVWQTTITDMRHPFLVTVECLYSVPDNPEADDDRWAGQQLCMQLIGDVKTTAAVRRDALQLLRELACAA